MACRLSAGLERVVGYGVVVSRVRRSGGRCRGVHARRVVDRRPLLRRAGAAGDVGGAHRGGRARVRRPRRGRPGDGLGDLNDRQACLVRVIGRKRIPAGDSVLRLTLAAAVAVSGTAPAQAAEHQQEAAACVSASPVRAEISRRISSGPRQRLNRDLKPLPTAGQERISGSCIRRPNRL